MSNAKKLSGPWHAHGHYSFCRKLENLGRKFVVYTFFKIIRIFRLSAMCRLLGELNRRRIDIGKRQALEVFAHTGELQTVDYAPKVASLEAWEIMAEKEEALRRNLPNAVVKIVDSHKEIKTTSKKFDFIVVDAPPCLYGKNDEYCEHFEIFPYVMRIAMPSTIIVISVTPSLPSRVLRGTWAKRHLSYSKEYLRRRDLFYRTGRPEKVSFDEMIEPYKRLAREGGFNVDWYFFKKKWRCYYYLVLGINLVSTAMKPLS